jgi:hypothetical protein
MRTTRNGLALRFQLGTAPRRKLIPRLYTGAYRNEVAEAKLLPALRGTLRRVLG